MINGLNVSIRIGDFDVIRAPEIRIVSERHRPLTRMGIVLPDPDRLLFKAISENDAVQISLGYRDQAPGIWAGTVSHIEPGNTKDQVLINCVGPEKPLVTTMAIQAWENDSPEAIIKWGIAQAGMVAGQVDSPGCVFPRFVADNRSVFELAGACEYTCQASFNIDMSRWTLWVDAAGKVNWGDFDEPADMPVIETGAGLIRHTPSGGFGKHHLVETFLIPGLRHSMKFKLSDSIRGVNGTFRALKVVHSLKDDTVRTFISYGDEYDKF